MNIARFTAVGSYVIEPDSRSTCPVSSFSGLAYTSVTRCFQAGANYDGYADLFGIDEFGVPHWSWFYAPPRWIGC